MHEVFTNVLSLILIFLLGVLLKKVGVFDHSDVQRLLKLFFYVSLPALILLAIPDLQLSAKLLFLPVSAALIIFATYLVAYVFGRKLRLHDRSFAVFLIGAMIMNGGFAFPFILTAYGEQGMALASLFDFGGAVVVFTFVYYQACHYGRVGKGGRQLLRKFLLAPPLLALSIAVVLNLAGLKIGNPAAAFLHHLAAMTTPVVLLALGIAFNHRVVRLRPLVAAVFIRMVMGCLFGLACTELFQLGGLAKTVTLIMASAPSGMNTLVFAAMEELDSEFAASVVSYATLLGILWIPLLIYLQS